MKKTILFTVLLINTSFSFAQVKYDYNWIFGYDFNSSTPEGEGTIIDFNNSPIAIDFLALEINIEQTNTTCSDSDGNLLFYSNGCSIYNSYHELMENGDSINAGEVYNNQCDDAYPIIQGALSLPLPNNDSIYYIFHQKSIFLTNPFDVQIDQLLCTKIDMALNNGKGEVVVKNEPVINNILEYGQLTAVKHENGNNWWVLVPGDTSDLYYSIQITSDTITEPSVQAIGLPMSYFGGGSGQALFNPDGTKYARYNQVDQVYLFDFDRGTGQLSNFQQLIVADTAHSGGVAFSPSGRFLYISSTFDIYQFDLWASDIQASRKTVATWDGFQELGFFSTTFALMQLGPDCRIYISTGSGTSFFHVIHYPDLEGEACEIQQRGLKLPSYSFHAMPHFPNYRLGITPTYPCDPSIDLPVAVSQVENPAIDFSLFPNPTSGVLHLELPEEVLSITITNTLGQTIHRWNNLEMHDHWTMPDLDLSNGLYFCTVESTNTQQTKSFLIIR